MFRHGTHSIYILSLDNDNREQTMTINDKPRVPNSYGEDRMDERKYVARQRQGSGEESRVS